MGVILLVSHLDSLLQVVIGSTEVLAGHMVSGSVDVAVGGIRELLDETVDIGVVLHLVHH